MQGFSLIELMVSLSIFAIVMTTSIGTLLVMIDASAKAQALYSVMTNLSFALDNVTRNIRTGYEHRCQMNLGDTTTLSPSNNDCSWGDAIIFNRMNDNYRTAYRLNNGALEQKECSPPPGVSCTGWRRLTGTEVMIDNFQVEVSGSDNGADAGNDTNQPVITLVVTGHVNNGLETDTDFSLQTRVTKRVLDY